MNHASLFSGIGGFDLAASWTGWDNIFQVEKDPFCQKVLAKNFPDTKRYGDIYEFDGKEYTGTVDILTGGFPCQPFSVAGQQRGTDDDRYLWPEMLRVIREIKPRWIVGENVTGIIKLALDQVISDLEAEGYTTETFVVPACAVNAPHRRDRIWIVANSNCRGFDGKEVHISKRKSRKAISLPARSDSDATDSTSNGRGSWGYTPEGLLEGDIGAHKVESGNRRGGETRRASCIANVTDPDSQRRVRRRGDGNPNERRIREGIEERKNSRCATSRCNEDATDTEKVNEQRSIQEGTLSGRSERENRNPDWSKNWLEVATRLCRVDDGVPRRLDRANRIKALGNAIVPQVALEIFKAIQEVERRKP